MTVASPARLLSDSDFRLWYCARVISQSGTAATAVALPLLVYQDSGSAGLTAAIAGLAVLPYLLFGLFAGAMADRVNRRGLMVGTDVAAAAALLTVPAAHVLGLLGVAQILIVAFAVASCFVWFDAGAWGALPRIVGRERLARANSLIISSSVVVGIAVPAVAGTVAAVSSPVLLLAADACTYLVSALLLARLRVELRPERDGRVAAMRADITEGLRFIWRQPVIRTLTLCGFGLAVTGGGVTGLTVVHAVEVLELDARDGRIGVLFSAAAVGALAAAALLPRLVRRFGSGAVSITGYAVVLAGMPLLAVNPLFIVACVLWLCWQAADTLAITNGITVRQLLTPDALQSRVNTTGRMIAWGGPLSARSWVDSPRSWPGCGRRTWC